MTDARPIFLEFFAGGGMARLGLQGAFDCVFANDVDPAKCASYRANFGGSDLVEGDVAALSAAQIPAADLAWASFPCQDLSLAGARAGMTGARSGTFWAFWRLMLEMKAERRAPAIIVIENVTGLLTSRKGADLEALTEAVCEAGYRMGGLILDAAAFVPQSRQRLFLVAWDPARLSLPTSDQTFGQSARLTKAICRMPPALRAVWHDLGLPAPTEVPQRVEAVLEADAPETVWRSEADLQKLLSQMTPLHHARVDAAVSENTPRAGAVYRRIRAGEQRAEVRYDGLAGCVRTLKGGSSRQLLLISDRGDLRLRPLLPREAARLMGLPETYVLPRTVTAATNLCGDGVCVPVVAWLTQHLLEPMFARAPRDRAKLAEKHAVSRLPLLA